MKTIRYTLLVLLLMCANLMTFAQQKKPTNQQAELDKAVKEAEAEIKKLRDPAYINKMFDDQIKEFKSQGTLSAELLKEIEKARAEMLKQAKSKPTTTSPNLPESTAPVENVEPTPPVVPQEIPDTYDETPSPYSKVPASFRFFRESKVTAETFVEFIKRWYKIDLIRLADEQPTHNGYLIRYQQVYQNISINNAIFKLFIDANRKPVYATGLLYDAKYFTELLSISQIKKAIVSHYQKQQILLQERPADAEPLMRSSGFWYSLLGLEMYAPNQSAPQLAYKAYISANSSYVYLHAKTGAILTEVSAIKMCTHLASNDSIVTVKTQRYGNVQVVTNIDPMGHWLIDKFKKPVVVHNERTQINFEKWKKTGFDFNKMPSADSSVRVMSSEEWNDPIKKHYKAGHYDANFAIKKALDFYKLVLNRVAPDPSVKWLVMSRFGSFVDEAALGKQINAFWNRSENEIAFMGDRVHKSLVDIDVLGHELTHGVIDYTADLEYWGESGALNEAISDMMGEAIEIENGKGDWLIGAGTFPNGLRSLKEPKRDSKPDTYEGTFWQDPALCTHNAKDKCYVHHNCGVANRWFYLVVNGGTGENDLKKKYDVKLGLGHRKAAQLVYQTLLKLHSKSNYEDFCQKSILTAEEMFGQCADLTLSVKNAWYAVGVLDDAPAPCKGYTFDLTYDPDPTHKIRFYAKGDSVVSVFHNEDGWTKSYTERSSAYISFVVQNADGIHTHTVTKNWPKSMLSMLEKSLPVQDRMAAEALAKARAELSDPTTSPERRAELNLSIPMVENMLKEGKKQTPEIMKDLKEASNEQNLATEESFWGDRKTKRDFDKKYIKETFKYEQKYLAKRYVVTPTDEKGNSDGTTLEWVSTTEIPLRMSDLGLFTPISSDLLRPGVDHFMRGFPLKMFGGITVKNIKETIPPNFDVLYSTSPTFN